MKRLFLAIVVVLFSGPSFAQGSLQTILTNGPTATRVNIVFLSDGFTDAELDAFLTDATNFLNGFLAVEPYNEYKSYFNAFAISIASNESGSDHPSKGIYKDTYFNSTFDSYGTERLLTIPPNDVDSTYSHGQGKVDALLVRLIPEFDIPIMIVNDTAYGGSGGSTPIASMNVSAREIAIHETGHSFAKLGDEYATAYPGYPDAEEPNTTRETRRELIKWRAWIDPTTPIPTPTTFTAQIGLFEGAHYHATGWFRPKFNCRMRTLGVPFCSVCAETLMKSIYGRIRPIESSTPATNITQFVTNDASLILAITPLKPITHSLSIQWFTNDVPVAGATLPAFAIQADQLADGTNKITVSVVDDTKYVRSDPASLLGDSRTWKVMAAVGGPRLSATFDGGILLSYSTSFPDFILEFTAEINPGATWTKVDPTPDVSGSEYVITLPAADARQYFRLKSNTP